MNEYIPYDPDFDERPKPPATSTGAANRGYFVVGFIVGLGLSALVGIIVIIAPMTS